VTFSNTRRYIWTPKNSRYNAKYTCKTVKYEGVSLMVWGAIRSDGKRILIKCPPRLGSSEYQEILGKGLSAVYDSEMVFMHDCDPCHRSASTLAFLDSKNVFHLSDWPLQSPDLNIIKICGHR